MVEMTVLAEKCYITSKKGQNDRHCDEKKDQVKTTDKTLDK